MSILIKGMEMPINCRYCAFRFLRLCAITEKQLKESEMYHLDEDCPIIPVPDHGRLIDADALEAEGADVCGLEYEYETVWGFSHDMIRDAPTIIPAEEGE
ncbi:MAG: hypothetical protein J6S60_06060 [Oscillospiraceae bacterium]|nr:hypothetical protein [Oscillospiraceae bacterium]